MKEHIMGINKKIPGFKTQYITQITFPIKRETGRETEVVTE
jgi:hypothetical protein